MGIKDILSNVRSNYFPTQNCLRSMFSQMTSKNPFYTSKEVLLPLFRYTLGDAQRVSKILKYHYYPECIQNSLVPLPRGFQKILKYHCPEATGPTGSVQIRTVWATVQGNSVFSKSIYILNLSRPRNHKIQASRTLAHTKFLKDHLCSRVTIPLSSTLSPPNTTLSIK